MATFRGLICNIALAVGLLSIVQPLHSWSFSRESPSMRLHRELIQLTSSTPFTVQLFHQDHSGSPLHQAGTTLKQRIRKAIGLSVERLKNVNNKVGSARYGDHKKFFNDDTLTPVMAPNHGSYLLSFSLGSPAQNFTVMADTGSDLIWIQCEPCVSCYNQPDPLFVPNKSSTYKHLRYSSSMCKTLPNVSTSKSKDDLCEYSHYYGDQSSTIGDFSADLLTMSTLGQNPLQVNNFVFGCGYQNEGTFHGVDGVAGLGQGENSLTSQLGQVFGKKFSYCLVPFENSTEMTSALVFGDVKPKSGSFSFTPLLPNEENPTFYYIDLQGISVDDQKLPIDPKVFSIAASGAGGTILDSAITITLLVRPAYDLLLARLKSLVKYPETNSTLLGLDLCYDSSTVLVPKLLVPKFPTVTFHFDRLDIELPSANVFTVMDNHGTVCLSMLSSVFGLSMIGNIQQQNFRLLFDRENNQIGFAPEQC